MVPWSVVLGCMATAPEFSTVMSPRSPGVVPRRVVMGSVTALPSARENVTPPSSEDA